MINLNCLEFQELYNNFYDFYYNAKKAGFYLEELEKMRVSMDEMYYNFFKK